MGPAGAPTLSGLIVSQEIIDGVCAPFDDLMQDSMDPLLYQFFPELEGLESPTAIAAQTPSSSLHDGDLLAYMDELEGGNKVRAGFVLGPVTPRLYLLSLCA